MDLIARHRGENVRRGRRMQWPGRDAKKREEAKWLEGGAFAELGLDTDGAGHAFHRFFDDGETNARAFVFILAVDAAKMPKMRCWS